jgi:hypothetical protein
MATQREELAALRAENDRLRAELETSQATMQADAGEKPQKKSVVRTIVAVPLILIGALLAPLAITAGWAATEVSNTDRFVANLAPLAKDPDVQAYVSSSVSTAIENKIDIDGLTNQAFTGIADIPGIPPIAANALESLAPAAANGLKGLLEKQVTKAVQSKAFATIWKQTLQLSHKQLVNILNNDQSGAIVISDTGKVGIQLAPVIAAVKKQLVLQGFPLANSIPAINTTVEVGTVKNINEIRTGYQTLLVLAAILPWVSILFLAIGVLVARRRPRALVGAGILLIVFNLILVVGVAIARVILGNAAARAGVPHSVTDQVFTALARTVTSSGIAAVVLGLAILLVGLGTGSSRQAVAVRDVVSAGFGRANYYLERHHLTSASFGRLMYQIRIPLRIIVVVIAIVILLLVRPLTSGVVALAAILCVLVIALIALFERHPGEPMTVGLPAGGPDSGMKATVPFPPEAVLVEPALTEPELVVTEVIVQEATVEPVADEPASVTAPVDVTPNADSTATEVLPDLPSTKPTPRRSPRKKADQP